MASRLQRTILKIQPAHVFLLLMLFWVVWIYSEVAERSNREVFQNEVHEFMNEGGRFTEERGNVLETNVEELKKQVEELKDEHP